MPHPTWHIHGLLFENCSCQLVCPAHISFKQNCTNERCTGHWSLHIDEGRYDDTLLNGLNAVICLLYTSPSPRDRQKSRMPSSA